MKVSTLIDSLFLWVSKYRNQLMTVLLSINWLLVALIFVGGYSTAVDDANSLLFYGLARECGEFAAFLFIIVSLPGIARRFKYTHKLIMILMMFRRQLGVMMYLLVLMHAFVLRFIPWITQQMPTNPEPFVIAGAFANMMLFALFVTSNDWSVKKFGDWWNKIQRMMYIIVWFIFIHLALFGIGKWTILIGITSVLQLASHIYMKQRLKTLN